MHILRSYARLYPLRQTVQCFLGGLMECLCTSVRCRLGRDRSPDPAVWVWMGWIQRCFWITSVRVGFFLVLYPIIKACFTRCLLLKRNESTTELHASFNCSCKPGTDNIRGGSRQRLFILLMWHYKRFVLWGVLGTSGRNHPGFPGNLFSSWLQSRLYAHDTEEL